MEIGKIIGSLLNASADQTPCSKLQGRLSSLTEEEIETILTALYQQYVEDRGMRLERDDDTLEKLHKVTKWLTVSKRPGLLLYGNCGRGKTAMLHALNRMLREGRPLSSVNLFTAQDLFDSFKDENRRMAYDDARKSMATLMDDLGCEPSRCVIYGTDYNPIRNFFYSRYDRQLITIVSTNLDDIQIPDIYGERVWDRMKEMFDRISYSGESYRNKF